MFLDINLQQQSDLEEQPSVIITFMRNVIRNGKILLGYPRQMAHLKTIRFY